MDKDRICEELAGYGDVVDPEWMHGNLRTLKGLLDEYEQNLVVAPVGTTVVTTPLESSTDDLCSVSLRSSLEEVHHDDARAGNTSNLAESWEGLGTGSSKTSLESLVAVEESHDVPIGDGQEEQSESHLERHDSRNSDGGDASKILLSVAAIGAAALGAFVAASSRSSQSSHPPSSSDNHRNEQQPRNRTNNNNTHNDQQHDSDWVQVEPRHQERDEE